MQFIIDGSEKLSRFLIDHSTFILIAVAVLSFVYYAWLRPILIGYIGELLVRLRLKRLDVSKYTVINDVLIKTAEGTTQIDHIVISEFGIFVIETKHMTGKVYASDYAEQWKVYYGKRCRKLFNPFRQNYGHVKNLESLLSAPEEVFKPILVFIKKSRLTLKRKDVKNTLLYHTELVKHICSITDKCITPEQKLIYINQINAANIKNNKNMHEHVKYVKTKKAE